MPDSATTSPIAGAPAPLPLPAAAKPTGAKRGRKPKAGGICLALRTGKGRRPTWVIREPGRKEVSTRCGQADYPAALAVLRRHIEDRNHGHKPGKGRPGAGAPLEAILNAYVDSRDPSPRASPDEVRKHKFRAKAVSKLLPFFAGKALGDLTPELCLDYYLSRLSDKARPAGGAKLPTYRDSTLRRELSVLSVAVRAHCRTERLQWLPTTWMPKRRPGRVRWYTRSEVARLVLACRGRIWDEEKGDWARGPNGRLLMRGEASRRMTRPLARFVLIGAWTGTRRQAILDAAWGVQAHAPHLDLAEDRFFRRGTADAETTKRRPPVPLTRQLRVLARLWERHDRLAGFGLVVHRADGRPIGHAFTNAWKRIRLDAASGPTPARTASGTAARSG